MGLMELAVLILVLIVVYGQMVGLHFLMERKHLFQDDVGQALFMLGFQVALDLLFLGLLGRHLRREGCSWREAFGFGAGGLTHTWLTVGVVLAAVLAPLGLVSWLTQLFFRWMGWPVTPQPILEFFLKIHEPWLRGLFILFAVGVAPVVEELLFRGLIYPCLKERLGMAAALTLTSALFAAFHFHAAIAPPLFLLSAAFILLYEWRGNLLACIVMHAGFNALSLSLLFVMRDTPF
jgi:membrane protease YdiL (CAAX protease family)